MIPLPLILQSSQLSGRLINVDENGGRSDPLTFRKQPERVSEREEEEEEEGEGEGGKGEVVTRRAKGGREQRREKVGR